MWSWCSRQLLDSGHNWGNMPLYASTLLLLVYSFTTLSTKALPKLHATSSTNVGDGLEQT